MDLDGLTSAQAAQLIAGNDIISELQSFPGGNDYNESGLDILKSRPIVEKTLDTFGQTFGKGIRKALQDSLSQASKMGEDELGGNRVTMAHLCLGMLALPTWPKEVPESLCTGVSLKSVVFANGPQSVVITPELIRAQYKDRACALQDYQRRNFIYQSFHGNPPKP